MNTTTSASRHTLRKVRAIYTLAECPPPRTEAQSSSPDSLLPQFSLGYNTSKLATFPMLLLSNNKPTHRRKVISALSRMAQLNITKLLETLAFAPQRFHVLVHSLFKVLFNFPSRYLFAIGLGVIFSLTWSLPRALSCTPKQLDSGEDASAARHPSYGPITLYGPWPQSRWTWTGRQTAR